jgi:heme-degrading monooxygenase HmoA
VCATARVALVAPAVRRKPDRLLFEPADRKRKCSTPGNGGRAGIEVFFRYRVHPAQARAFEHAYGPAGPWVELFSQYPGFRRSRLFRHKNESGVYISVDIWETKADWDHFRVTASEAYARLDRELHMLYLEEHLIGYYEGEEEYRPSFEGLA